MPAENSLLLIPSDLAQAIADYLVTRPYREVAHLVASLAQIKPPPEVNKTPANPGTV